MNSEFCWVLLSSEVHPYRQFDESTDLWEPLSDIPRGWNLYPRKMKMIVHALISLCVSRRGHWRHASLEVLCTMRIHHILRRHVSLDDFYNCGACQLGTFLHL